MKSTKLKKTSALAVTFLVVVLVVGAYFFSKNDASAHTEIFKDIDYSVEDGNLDVSYINYEALENGDDDGFITGYTITSDEFNVFIEALKKAEFIEIDYNEYKAVEPDFRVNLTLNKRYELAINTEQHYLAFYDDVDSATGHLYFKLDNDNSEFFTLLSELKEKAPTK